ncbi:hypothetical protein HR060_12195 [Catenovulum sp. SM1970]|uniref:hypothetical protein n=1 Tax=Marinifaba aquimaris TaxID=2741323 RepID=UPI0015732EA5|nr:hypothetical protein [Marinifaba aquimaris]NTS77621.1 hypothetical protein [Marinifaba aquimaris]
MKKLIVIIVACLLAVISSFKIYAIQSKSFTTQTQLTQTDCPEPSLIQPVCQRN